jgi:hypothetical protein
LDKVDQDRLIRRNIEINAARANREWAKGHNLTEAPEEIRKSHRQLLENAEYERERKENSKRGVK